MLVFEIQVKTKFDADWRPVMQGVPAEPLRFGRRLYADRFVDGMNARGARLRVAEVTA